MENENSVLRLVKPRRKGLLSLVFSRFFLIVLLLAAQILLYAAILIWMMHTLRYYAVLQTMFIIGMAIYLFNNRMDTSVKVTWLALIAVVPLFGGVLLAYTQSNLGHRSLSKRTAELIRQTRDAVLQDPAVLKRLEDDPCGTDDLQRYLNRSGNFPIFDHTEVKYLPIGEDMLVSALEELEKAEKYIFLEFFIIEEGYMWGSILNVLARKAKEGVDIRVLYDGTNEITTLPHDYPGRLGRLGIKAKTFAPIRPFLSSHYNYRDHRKIIVIDGKVAFNGGINLADEYINRKERCGHWKDTAVMLKGEAARSFTLMFLQMWNINEQQAEFPSGLMAPVEGVNGSGFVMPYGDCPLDEDKVGEAVYMDILYHATDYVHVMTPYLILDGELSTALKYAAQRGVDVRLILPGIPDNIFAHALAKSHYKELTDAGVQIFEYTPGFVHAKVWVSDSIRAVVGTINLDYRSLYHHFECATYLYQTSCIRDIEEDFEQTLQQCRVVTSETIRNEKTGYRIIGPLLKIIAPLM